jgi:hypothetical protein
MWKDCGAACVMTEFLSNPAQAAWNALCSTYRLWLRGHISRRHHTPFGAEGRAPLQLLLGSRDIHRSITAHTADYDRWFTERVVFTVLRAKLWYLWLVERLHSRNGNLCAILARTPKVRRQVWHLACLYVIKHKLSRFAILLNLSWKTSTFFHS